MNESSKHKAPTIDSWLTHTTHLLKQVGVPSARLDAELLLASAHQQSRTWLIAHQNDNIDDPIVLENASKLLAKRLKRLPLAYMTNHKEFYNRSFFVDERVLIPRPESETIIELLKKLHLSDKTRMLDVGTGSGALGITAKLEIPALNVTVSDISETALAVARKNAKTLHATPIRFVHSDLLRHWLSHKSARKFDVIIANLPYVNPEWQQSRETSFEPPLALYAEDNGLALIKKCIQQASKMTSVGGYLLLEADPEQHQKIVTFAADNFKHLETQDYIVVLKKK